MELLKLKRRLQFAVRGHKLLKDKQESLMQEFMRVLKNLRNLYQEVTKELGNIYGSFYQAQVGAEPFALEEILAAPSGKVLLDVVLKHTGYRTPSFSLKNFKQHDLFSPASAPLSLSSMIGEMYQFFPKLVSLAEIEKKLELLAGEIEKTRRRVNALEYNLIPALRETIHDIVMKLEERDRAERTTLMKIKTILQNA